MLNVQCSVYEMLDKFIDLQKKKEKTISGKKYIHQLTLNAFLRSLKCQIAENNYSSFQYVLHVGCLFHY